MEFHYLFKGILIGISVSVPLGPMGAMMIQRTIHKGLPSGIASGSGIAIGDTIYALIAGFGLTFISGYLETHQLYFRLLGGIILLFMGYNMFKSDNFQSLNEKRQKKDNLFLDFISLLLLTVSNPFTVLIFGAAFAGMNIFASSQNTTTVLVAGIFLGALIWWLVVGLMANLLRDKLNFKAISIVNKVTGVLVVLLGFVAMLSIFVLD